MSLLLNTLKGALAGGSRLSSQLKSVNWDQLTGTNKSICMGFEDAAESVNFTEYDFVKVQGYTVAVWHASVTIWSSTALSKAFRDTLICSVTHLNRWKWRSLSFARERASTTPRKDWMNTVRRSEAYRSSTLRFSGVFTRQRRGMGLSVSSAKRGHRRLWRCTLSKPTPTSSTAKKPTGSWWALRFPRVA